MLKPPYQLARRLEGRTSCVTLMNLFAVPLQFLQPCIDLASEHLQGVSLLTRCVEQSRLIKSEVLCRCFCAGHLSILHTSMDGGTSYGIGSRPRALVSRGAVPQTTKVFLRRAALPARRSRQSRLHVSAIAAPLSRPETIPASEEQERVFVDRVSFQ